VDGGLLYRFEDYALDTGRRELRRGLALVAVEPQVFDLLVFLLSKRDRVVSKEDLLASVWGGRIVSESTLDSRINAARRAIGDSGRDQRLIRTIIGKGVRFIGTVEEQPPESAPATAAPTPRLSIVVLPFGNLSNDPEQDYFADGVVEEITTAIARVPSLFVIARNSAFTYKGRAVDVKQVARELGVHYVLEGSIRKAADRVRITGQLIEAETASHLWVDRFEGTLDNIFELQDRVASGVAGAIEPKLRLAEIERVTRKPTGSLDAYDLFLRGLAEFHKYTPHALSQAVSLLCQGLTLDPDYALPAALISECQLLRQAQGWGTVSANDISEALGWAHHAIERGRDDPEALAWAAGALLFFAGEHTIVAGALDRALAINPNAAFAWAMNGWLYAVLAQPKRAIPALRQAIRLSPLDPLTWIFAAGLAMAHLTMRQFEEAIAWADRSLHYQPRYISALRIKLVATAHFGGRDASQKLLTQLLALLPGLTIGQTRALLGQAMCPELWDLYEQGLRIAGLPD
jgi:TolB-like protein